MTSVRYVCALAIPLLIAGCGPKPADVTQSFDDYQGLPSAQARGVADGAEHYSRFVIATVPPAHYLVQLAATSPDGTPIAQSPELTSIIDGFTVAAQ